MTQLAAQITTKDIRLLEMDDAMYRTERHVTEWSPLDRDTAEDYKAAGAQWLTAHGYKVTGRWVGDGSGWSMFAPIAVADVTR